MRRARLVVAYSGTAFRGVAANRGVRTVMGELVPAVTSIVRHPVEFSLSGRTDAGVHGWGQVISGDLPEGTDLAGLQHRINRWLGPEISIRHADWAAPDFDARNGATSRRYRYHVWANPVPNPLISDSAWHVHQPLDLDHMHAAANALVGEHDFGSFCRRQKMPDGVEPASLVRIVYTSQWSRVDDSPLLRYEISASSFCQQMVRAIVGTLVEMGYGRIDYTTMPAILVADDRSRAGAVAPPHGLILWEVRYDGVRWDDENTSEPPRP